MEIREYKKLVITLNRTRSVSLPDIGRSLRSNPDLAAAVIFAGATTAAVPFSLPAMLGSINTSLISILFCLMAIIAGLRQGGILTYSYRLLFSDTVSSRRLVRFFVFSCFTMSMAVTNDVALIIFVPLAVMVLQAAGMQRHLIFAVTFQTIAANMGSILTPIGNPQNLFIYSYYHMTLWEFLKVTGPITAVSGILLYLISFYIPNYPVDIPSVPAPVMKKRTVLVLICLLGLCILTVLRVLTPAILVGIVCPVLFLTDRSVFRGVDYKLIFLFIFLFIGVGNLGRLPFFADGTAALLQGHELFVSLLLSQVLSNVPTTVLLAPYTQHVQPLLAGVNIGGLGTIIASMASIISFKVYADCRDSRPVRYLLIFTTVNMVFLLSVLAAWCLLE